MQSSLRPATIAGFPNSRGGFQGQTPYYLWFEPHQLLAEVVSRGISFMASDGQT